MALLLPLILCGCSRRAPAPAVSTAAPISVSMPAETSSSDEEDLRQREAQVIQELRADPRYRIEGAFYFTQEEYSSVCALDENALATFCVTSTRCAAQNAVRDAQIELAAEFLYRECDAAVYAGGNEANDPGDGEERCFITASPALLWKLSAYMLADGGTLYHISPDVTALSARFDKRTWPLSPQEAQEALSRMTLSNAEYARRQRSSREFHESNATSVGCFFLYPKDHEAFLSLPQQENCVFRVSWFPARQYTDAAACSIATAEIFTAAGCKAEVYYGKGTENGEAYEGYACFVTTTPERMWKLGSTLDSGDAADFFFIEPQYEEVARRMDTLIWPA